MPQFLACFQRTPFPHVSAWIDVSCKSVLTPPCIDMAELSVVEWNLAVSFLIRMYLLVRAVVTGRSPSTFHGDLLPPFSGSKRTFLLSSHFTGCLLDLLFDTEERSSMLLRNVSELLRTAPLYIPKDSSRHSNCSWEYKTQQNIPDRALSKTTEIVPIGYKPLCCGQRGVKSRRVYSITCTYIFCFLSVERTYIEICKRILRELKGQILLCWSRTAS